MRGLHQNLHNHIPSARPRTETVYNYNGRGLPTQQLNYALPQRQLLSGFTGMTYDSAGNRLTENTEIPAVGAAPDLSRSVTYSYDSRSELTEEHAVPLTGSAGAELDKWYSYDNAGNPTDFRGSSPGLAAAGFTPDNQFNPGDYFGFSYDGNGNPTNYDDLTLLFDPLDRLLGVQPGSGSAPPLTSGYGPDDLRTWSVSGAQAGNNTSTFYVYDGETPIAELDQSGNVQALNGFGASGWESRDYPAGSNNATAASQAYDNTYTYDPQGNLIQRHPSLVGSGLPASDTSLFDAYGALVAGQLANPPSGSSGQITGPADPVGFAGQFGGYTEQSSNGYTPGFAWSPVLLTHREYDVQSGRFINRDPIGYNGGLNLYGYAGNNPITTADPSGYQSQMPAMPTPLSLPRTDPWNNPLDVTPANSPHFHLPDQWHTDAHWDINFPRDTTSKSPLRSGVREFRFDPSTGTWEEKEQSIVRTGIRIHDWLQLKGNSKIFKAMTPQDQLKYLNGELRSLGPESVEILTKIKAISVLTTAAGVQAGRILPYLSKIAQFGGKGSIWYIIFDFIGNYIPDTTTLMLAPNDPRRYGD